MRKRTILVLVILTSLMGTQRAATARGLLGERYAGIQFGITRPGDSLVRNIDSSVIGLGVELNLPASDSVDLAFSFSHQELDGTAAWGRNVSVDTNAFLGGANLLLSPDQKTCPFLIGRFGVVDMDNADTEPMIVVGGGVQLDITETGAVTPSLVFQHVDDVDDVVLSVEGNKWFSDNFVGLAGIGVGFDEGDLMFTFGVGLAF